jgi:hypothetical protein
MSDSQQLLFYYREGCHLCEELASLLHRGWPRVFSQLQWRDVDSRPQWRDLYGLRVPVLSRGRQVLCELKPEPACLREHFGAPDIPV